MSVSLKMQIDHMIKVSVLQMYAVALRETASTSCMHIMCTGSFQYY